MFVWFINVLLCVAATGHRGSALGPLRMSLQSAPEGGCPVIDGGGTRNRFSYRITRSSDFELVPHDMTGIYLQFSADHRVEFGRGTLPKDLGGQRLVRLLMSVRYAPGRRLPPGFFINLARLRSLQLYNDAPNSERILLRLSKGAFDGLSEVVDLQLARLGIEDLPTGVFRGLRSICRLDLSQNRLAIIGSGVFQPPSVSIAAGLTENRCCRNLTTLLLGRNRFVDVANIRLGGLTSLRSADLFGNAIARVERGSFGGGLHPNSPVGGFANVDQMNLGLNVIGQIEDRAFEGLVRLRILYLDGNMIHNVTASAFSGLPELETLDVGGNSISELWPGVFTPLTSLRTLRLAENAMQTMQTGT